MLFKKFKKSKTSPPGFTNAHGLRSQTVSALKWSTMGTFLNVALQIVVVAVMGRLLGPKEYGLLAMANVFNRFTAYFSQMGLGPALIQRKEIGDEDIRASFTLAVILGLAFTVITILVSPVATTYFQDDAVGAVVCVLAFSMLIGGFSLTAISLLRRELNFKAIAVIEAMAFALGNGLVAILLAWLGFGIWSLVIGILTQQTIIALVALFVTRHSFAPLFSLSAYRRCLGYGAHYSMNTFLDFLYGNIDTILVGRLFITKTVGFYNRAFTLANMPVERFITSITRVMFPAFSKLQDQKEKLCEAFATVFMIIGLVSGGISCGMIPAAREIVLVVLGSKWIEAIVPLQVLALAVPLQFLMSQQGVLLDSVGKLAARTKIRVFGLTLKICLLSVGAAIYGFNGFLWAILIVQFCQQIVYTPFITKSIGLSLSKFYFLYFVIFVNGCIVAAFVQLATIGGRAAGFPMPVVLVGQIAIGAASLLGTLLIVGRYSIGGIHREALQAIPILGRLWR